MYISGSEQLLEALITLVVFGAFYVLFNIQLRGEKRDRLISIILESYPSGVTILDSGEVTIRWTNGSKTLNITYQENVLKDFYYKYQDKTSGLATEGCFNTVEEFNNILALVLSD